MAVKRARRRRRNKNSSGESASAARLAPPEERGDGKSGQLAAKNDGTLSVNTGQLKLPADFKEDEEDAGGLLFIDPAVLVILCFSLIFILVIAYIIWNGWEPPRY